jgi:branched-chain amino acid transport system substrate-binding protein
MGRLWRRFRRRPPGQQAATLAGVLVLLAGLVYGLTSGTSSPSGSKATTSTTGRPGQPTTTAPPPRIAGLLPSNVSVSQASTSARGVTATSINVVFPVTNLTNLSGTLGFAGDAEFNYQVQAIHTFVNAVNGSGGIFGRKINPMIVDFDPTNETEMRSLCKQWTEGNPPVFAVVDGLGDWTGDNELCIAQEGHTPFIGEWSTISAWTAAAAPYLWWLGPDQSQILATLVQWAKGAGYIGGHNKLGIVVGDDASDQAALNYYLIPDLKAAGISGEVVQVLPSDPSNSAATNAAAPLVVQRLQSDGVNVVIPLVPFNAYLPYLSKETTQHFFPRLLLSDYQSTINLSLGLIPFPFEQALDNQVGITTETLGGTDAPTSAVKAGGYDAGVQACYEIFKAHNKLPLAHESNPSPYIEEQGPIAGWCQAVEVLGAALHKAGPDLNRRSFVEAMATLSNFKGTWSPVLSFGPSKFAGPSQYQVVSVHNNVPPSSQCVLKYDGKPQGTCWHVIQSWKPLDSG